MTEGSRGKARRARRGKKTPESRARRPQVREKCRGERGGSGVWVCLLIAAHGCSSVPSWFLGLALLVCSRKEEQTPRSRSWGQL